MARHADRHQRAGGDDASDGGWPAVPRSCAGERCGADAPQVRTSGCRERAYYPRLPHSASRPDRPRPGFAAACFVSCTWSAAAAAAPRHRRPTARFRTGGAIPGRQRLPVKLSAGCATPPNGTEDRDRRQGPRTGFHTAAHSSRHGRISPSTWTRGCRPQRHSAHRTSVSRRKPKRSGLRDASLDTARRRAPMTNIGYTMARIRGVPGRMAGGASGRRRPASRPRRTQERSSV